MNTAFYPLHFTWTFSFDIVANSEPIFLKPALIFTFENECYVLICMIIFKLHCQIILLI